MSLFEIVDEGASAKLVQHSYIYGEGSKHRSVQVASMLHHFFSHQSTHIVNAKVLHLNSDSCTAQNNNKIVLAIS